MLIEQIENKRILFWFCHPPLHVYVLKKKFDVEFLKGVQVLSPLLFIGKEVGLRTYRLPNRPP
jgi:hypothetical protein